MEHLKVISPPRSTDRVIELAAEQVFDTLLNSDERMSEQIADLTALAETTTKAVKRLTTEVNKIKTSVKGLSADMVELKATTSLMYATLLDIHEAIAASQKK